MFYLYANLDCKIFALPDEVLGICCDYLPVVSLVAASRINKKFHSLIAVETKADYIKKNKHTMELFLKWDLWKSHAKNCDNAVIKEDILNLDQSFCLHGRQFILYAPETLNETFHKKRYQYIETEIIKMRNRKEFYTSNYNIIRMYEVKNPGLALYQHDTSDEFFTLSTKHSNIWKETYEMTYTDLRKCPGFVHQVTNSLNVYTHAEKVVIYIVTAHKESKKFPSPSRDVILFFSIGLDI